MCVTQDHFTPMTKPIEPTFILFKTKPLPDVTDNIMAYLIVYACDDKDSFDRAVDTLYLLRQKQHRDEIIIFVGNKSDLVRSRAVTPEGTNFIFHNWSSKKQIYVIESRHWFFLCELSTNCCVLQRHSEMKTLLEI